MILLSLCAAAADSHSDCDGDGGVLMHISDTCWLRFFDLMHKTVDGVEWQVGKLGWVGKWVGNVLGKRLLGIERTEAEGNDERLKIFVRPFY